MKHLDDGSEPRMTFERFNRVARNRDDEGGLQETTSTTLTLMRNDVRHFLNWPQDGESAAVEEEGDNGRQPSASQSVTSERFPVRIFSQGQIAAMAGESRQALLDVIDEAVQAGDLHREFEEAKRTYFSQRARLRELDGRLESRSELKRRLADLNRKLEAMSQSHHAEVLKAHQQAQRQRREVDVTLEQLQEAPARIESSAQDLLLDDWPEGAFDSKRDADALAWKTEAERILGEAREALARAAHALSEKVRTIGEDRRLAEWRRRADQALTDYRTLRTTLAEQGVTAPRVFGLLVQERQELESRLKQLDQIQEDRDNLETENQAQWDRVLNARNAIAFSREEFLKNILAANTSAANKFVRMKVIGFGFEARNIERSLRDLLDVQDERFENDVLWYEGGEPAGGLARELACADDPAAVLEDVKRRLVANDEGFGGHFRNYLQRKLEKPEFADHIRCWFPEDDLRIEYSRAGGWRRLVVHHPGLTGATLGGAAGISARVWRRTPDSRSARGRSGQPPDLRSCRASDPREQAAAATDHRDAQSQCRGQRRCGVGARPRFS